MKQFRYSLDPVVKKHAWDVDALRVELSTLNRAIEAKQEELLLLTKSVTQTEQEMVETSRKNADISISRWSLIQLYLRDQQRRIEEKEREIMQARALADAVLQQLIRTRQTQRGMEKHCERTKKNFDAENLRQAFLEADDLWLGKLVREKHCHE